MKAAAIWSFAASDGDAPRREEPADFLRINRVAARAYTCLREWIGEIRAYLDQRSCEIARGVRERSQKLRKFAETKAHRAKFRRRQMV